MSFRRIITAASAAIVLLASTATAQPARVEFGLFGDYLSFTDSLGLDNGFGGGVRLGLFFLSRLELEGAVSAGTADFAVATPASLDAYVPIRARLIYNQPLTGGVWLLLGGGYVNNQFIVDGTAAKQDGWGGLVGLRLNLGRRLALRLDGTADVLPDLDNEINYGLQGGFSLLFGGGPSYSSDDWDDFGQADAPSERDEMADADGDGVADHLDRCPGTPVTRSVDWEGCAIFANEIEEEDDEAPAAAVEPTPEEPAPEPEAEPEVPEPTFDPTPAEPMPAAVEPEPAPELPPGDAPPLREGTVEGVGFKPGWWILQPGSEAVLDRLTRSMLAQPSVKIEIIGHTDSTGTRRRNMWLSGYRAEAVKLYLTQRGVSRDRIITSGRGPDEPIASNDTAAGRAQNRRVEIRILP